MLAYLLAARRSMGVSFRRLAASASASLLIDDTVVATRVRLNLPQEQSAR